MVAVNCVTTLVLTMVEEYTLVKSTVWTVVMLVLVAGIDTVTVAVEVAVLTADTVLFKK